MGGFPPLLEPISDHISRHEYSFDGLDTIVVDRSNILPVLNKLKDSSDSDGRFLLDLCAVDNKSGDRRFEVVYHVANTISGERLRIKVELKDDDPAIPSVSGVWKNADWYEREAWDLLGIRFQGHPGLERILTPPGFSGHALRKDFRFDCSAHGGLGTDAGADTPGKGQGTFSETNQPEIELGPEHPSMHGILKTTVQIDGEQIRRASCEIGFQHRGFEKLAESTDWNAAIMLADRLNYDSASINGIAFALATEELLQIQAPERARSLRLIFSELSRINAHLLCLSSVLTDVDASLDAALLLKAREKVLIPIQESTGGRLSSIVRIGGLAHDVCEDFQDQLRRVVQNLPQSIAEGERLIRENPTFRRRTEGVGVMTSKEALEWGCTGPCLRAAGTPYDVRKAHPYLGYEDIDFHVPVASDGDAYSRCLVRLEEIRQSLNIIDQAATSLSEGPVAIDDPAVTLPQKADTYTNIKSMIRHFNLITDGIHVPPGEVHQLVEGSNGALGMYLVSDGGTRPYRLKVFPPSFAMAQFLSRMLVRHTIADIGPILSSLSINSGELDR